MRLLDRLTESMRGALQPGTSGPQPGTLSDRLGIRTWSDDALRAELERRRRARGRAGGRRPAADDELDALAAARRDRMRERTLAKCYAQLEIPVGSSRIEAQRAYRTMLRQYHPDRYLGDAEQHAASVALITGLTDAYLAILAHHERR